MSSDIQWPRDSEQSLGIKLSLFRYFSTADAEEISRFGFIQLRTGRDVNDNAHAVIERMFMPMARELRRYLEYKLSEVPAADRVVEVNRNSIAYHEAVAALEKLEETLRGANDYPDLEERERIVAEVSAARRIFQAARVRVGVVVSLLAAPALYLVKTFAGTAIGNVAER